MNREISWPGWETKGLIGRGSFGEVYKIQRDVFGDVEQAALKVISIPQNTSDIDEMYNDGYDDESITSTFQSHLKSIVGEYSLMRKMNGISNIVNCDDIRYTPHADGMGWDIFIKMELLTPLAKSLPADIPEATVINVAKDMCAALELCKKHGIIHRDIKPQNIFVSPNGDYKLGDFGIAKTVEKTMGGTKIGTYKYMAPEVYNNQPYGTAADIYSLGLVLYWMLNERRMPFLPLPPEKLKAGMEEEARNRRLAGEPLPPPAHGSEKLKNIVLKACAPEVENRYQSAEALLRDLKKLSVGVVIPAGDSETADDDIVIPDKNGEEHGAQDDPVPDPGPVITDDVPAPDEGGQKDKEETPPPPPPPPQPKPRKKHAGVIVAICISLVIILLFLMKSCDGNGGNGGNDGNTPAADNVQPGVQADWSNWEDALPAYVSPENYEIETKTLYSSRELQTTSSTESDTMAGWELYDTVKANGDYGPWSNWSSSNVSGTDMRQVQTEIRYRYRDKETTTGSSSSKDGWTLYDTTYSWGNYGAWSNWSTSAVSKSDYRDVGTKTQYSYSDRYITQEWSSWGGWSSWSKTSHTESESKEVQTRKTYAYYYYLCPTCGHHDYYKGYKCKNGCGTTIPDNFIQVWAPVSWDDAGLVWVTGDRYKTYINGELVYKWPSGGSRTEYRYRTRSLISVENYTSWSAWSDSPYYESSTRKVKTRTLYRYRDRAQVATYHFYRWGNWSKWSTNKVTESDVRQVEQDTYYRYRDKATTTTYYFRRWTDWTPYSSNVVEASENVEVSTKTQYRYKEK